MKETKQSVIIIIIILLLLLLLIRSTKIVPTTNSIQIIDLTFNGNNVKQQLKT